jgi:peptidoglycan/xylan/chitin deacetylase (PgdA/CDA1 family)
MAPEVSPAQKKRRRWMLGAGLSLLGAAMFLSLGGHRALERGYRSNLPVWDRPDRTVWRTRVQAAAAAPVYLWSDDYGPDSHRRPLIALTFDDGPYPLHTSVLLATLKEHQVKATFFLVGRRVHEFPELARRITDDGHELANHTFSHRREGELEPGELEQELLKAEQAMAEVTGVRPHLFRPAGGSLSPEGIAQVKGLGYTLVDYTVNPGDWWIRSSEDLLKGSFRGRSREGVVLLHTGNLPLVRALPVYIETMRAKGFRFVTVSELVEAVDAPLPVSPRLQPGESAGTLSGGGL